MIIQVTLYIIFAMAFSQGLWSLASVSTIIPKTVLDLGILFLFLISIQQRAKHNEKYYAFGFIHMLAFFIVSFVSFSISSEPLLAFLLFCRHIFIFYIFFLALINLEINQKRIYQITKFVKILFLIQIPASFVKFFVVGQEEGRGIGTMSVHAGSLTTVFVLFSVGFCFSLYLFKKKNIYLLAIIGFFLFGLIGEKRALAFYLPVLFAVVAFFYAKRYGSKSRLMSHLNIKLILLTVMISGGFLFCAVKMIPSLNRKQRVGGKFEFSYLIQIAKETTTWRADGFDKGQIHAPGSGKKLSEPGKLTLGRYATTMRSLQILKDAGPVRVLFGNGAGSLIQTRILNRGSIGQITLRKYNIAYGITGFAWTILQVGLLGALLLVLFFFKLFKKGYILYCRSQDPNFKAVALGFISCSFVFLLDFFTYSRAFVTLGILTPVYYYSAFVLFRNYVPKYKGC